MQHYIMYDKITGMIKSAGCVDNISQIKLRNNCELASVGGLIDTSLHYFDLETNKVLKRPKNSWQTNITVSASESFVFEDVPDETSVYLNDDFLATISDGTLELDIPLSGSYKLKLKPPFPYYEHIVKVEVV